jgi:hypothetical protein
MDTDERDDDETIDADLGGIGEGTGTRDDGEDGMGSLPHMPVEDEPDR